MHSDPHGKPLDPIHIKQELARRERARRSYRHFVEYFYPDFKATPFHISIISILEQFVQDCEQGRSPCIIIEAPPRHGKSLLCTRALAPYYLMRNPRRSFVGASATQTLADYFGIEMRRICNDSLYGNLSPDAIPSKASNSVGQMITNAGGGYFLCSTESQLTGIGADVLVIDDPIPDENFLASQTEMTKLWDWYNSVALSRVQNGGGVIVMHTRWAVNDLAGRILESDAKMAKPRWKRHTFQAIADESHQTPFQRAGEALSPSLVPLERLTTIRDTFIANGKAKTWASLYQQSPYVEQGDFFQREWLITMPPDKMPHSDTLSWVIGTDLAASTSNRADYTALIPIGFDKNGTAYVHPGYVHKRLTVLQTIDELIRLTNIFHPQFIAMEKGPLNSAIRPPLAKAFSQAGVPLRIREIARTQGKHIQAASYQAALQSNRVILPDTPHIHAEIIPQHLQFSPEGDNAHDDFIDAMANAFLVIHKTKTPTAPRSESKAKSQAQIEDEQWARIMKGGASPVSAAPFTKLNGDSYATSRKY